MQRMAIALLAVSCATGRWESAPAEKPATPAELALYPVTIQTAAIDGLPEALARAGFRVAPRTLTRQELQLSLRVETDTAVATLRSDGFFVDEVRAPASSPDDLARALARSRRVAEFVRNSGTPEQRSLPGQ
jgi:hypothetical protein